MSAFSFPRTTGSLPGKRFRASSRYGKWSKFGSGSYAPMRGIRWFPATTSQLTTFFQWEYFDSTIHPSGRSRETSPTPPRITWPRWLLPRGILCHTPGGCDSTPRPGSLSPSRAWGLSSLSWRHESPVGGQICGRPGYYLSPGWVPGGGMVGSTAAVVPIEVGHRHTVSDGWIIWPFFTPAVDLSDSPRFPQ